MIQSSSLDRLKTSLLAPAATVAAFTLSSTAYSATMNQVPVTDNVSSGISSSNTYTHAFEFGSTDSGGDSATYTVNGVVFTETPLSATSNTDATTGNTMTIGTTVGALGQNAGNAVTVNGVTGDVHDLYKDFLLIDNVGPAGTQISFTLDGLQLGQNYLTRFYGYGWADANTTDRTVTLSTDVDGTTGDFEWGQYGTGNAFYIDTTYTASGPSATFTMTTLDNGNGPHISAITNQIAIPEPTSVALLAGGAALFGIVRRRKLPA